MGLKQTHLVSGPLNGVFDDRRERLESAEWDLLFWRVPLISKGKDLFRSNVKTKFCVGMTNVGNKQQTFERTHMAIVGLCQIGHNDFCVSFRSHGARVQERSLIGYTAADKLINAVTQY